ncbi:unnamed protein product [Ectocarpus sp. 4 AP-2014]
MSSTLFSIIIQCIIGKLGPVCAFVHRAHRRLSEIPYNPQDRFSKTRLNSIVKRMPMIHFRKAIDEAVPTSPLSAPSLLFLPSNRAFKISPEGGEIPIANYGLQQFVYSISNRRAAPPNFCGYSTVDRGSTMCKQSTAIVETMT